MYQRMVVALDGSPLAERILPHVEALGQKFGATVTLVRALRPPSLLIAPPVGGIDPVAGIMIDTAELIERERDETTRYLEGVADRLRQLRIEVECIQPDQPAADSILQIAASPPADLIAMTTHGRSGFSKLVYGSVAETVLHHAPCPVLLVRIPAKDEAGS